MSDPLLKLCRFVSETDLSSIPEPVIRQAKRVLLDTLGVITAGSASKAVDRFARRTPRCAPEDRCVTCPGRPGGFDKFYAAMLNGMAGSTLEYEEGNSRAMGHPGSRF